VLYIERDDAPHDVSVHKTEKAVQLALRKYVKGFAKDVGEDWSEVKRADFMEFLSEYGKHARIYRCSDDDSQEVE
jgi:hypothetical protein